MNSPAAGPLQDVTVIELAHIMAGPVCGRMLADMGADVIKVERVPDQITLFISLGLAGTEVILANQLLAERS